MLRTKIFLRVFVVVAALLVSVPSLVLAQATQDPSACKRTYRTCIGGKQLSDVGAKAQCAQTYRECLTSAMATAKAQANTAKTTPTTKTNP